MTPHCIGEVRTPDSEALQWAVKTLRFLMPGTPVGPHAAFEEVVNRLAHGVAPTRVPPAGVWEVQPEQFHEGSRAGWEVALGVALPEVPVTLKQVEQLAKTMWKGEPVPGRVLRFGAAVLGLADAMHPDCTAPDCDCEPGIECAARGASRGVKTCWACNGTGVVTTSSNGSGLIDEPCANCAVVASDGETK